MRHWKCDNCHHEWDSSKRAVCDWCGSSGSVLAETPPTPINMILGGLLSRLHSETPPPRCKQH